MAAARAGWWRSTSLASELSVGCAALGC
jgi:hypothetical protein